MRISLPVYKSGDIVVTNLELRLKPVIFISLFLFIFSVSVGVILFFYLRDEIDDKARQIAELKQRLKFMEDAATYHPVWGGDRLLKAQEFSDKIDALENHLGIFYNEKAKYTKKNK